MGDTEMVAEMEFYIVAHVKFFTDIFYPLRKRKTS